MLQRPLQDPVTRNDNRFRSIMHRFYVDFAGRRTTTEDFIETAERATGQDLGWFFDEWVYGTDLPTYRFATMTQQDDLGQYVIHLRVRQEGVPESFRMTVPVLVEFTDGQSGIVRMEVAGPVTEMELPPLAMEPHEITLNPDESVLAKVENEKW
jgi:aminopeptidase N